MIDTMKRMLLLLAAVVLSANAFAQLIANKTDKKVTVNLDVFNDFQLYDNENWDARLFSQGFSCAATYNFPLGESKKHTVSLGLGYTGHNYFSYNHLINPYTKDTLQFVSCRDEEGFKRNKLNCNYIDIPIELRFRIKDAWKIGVGFKFGLLVNAKTKYVGTNEEGIRVHEKFSYIPNVERYAYAATLRVGYKSVSLYTALQLVQVFEVGHNAPRLVPISVGLTFAPF